MCTKTANKALPLASYLPWPAEPPTGYTSCIICMICKGIHSYKDTFETHFFFHSFSSTRMTYFSLYSRYRREKERRKKKKKKYRKIPPPLGSAQKEKRSTIVPSPLSYNKNINCLVTLGTLPKPVYFSVLSDGSWYDMQV